MNQKATEQVLSSVGLTPLKAPPPMTLVEAATIFSRTKQWYELTVVMLANLLSPKFGIPDPYDGPDFYFRPGVGFYFQFYPELSREEKELARVLVEYTRSVFPDIGLLMSDRLYIDSEDVFLALDIPSDGSDWDGPDLIARSPLDEALQILSRVADDPHSVLTELMSHNPQNFGGNDNADEDEDPEDDD